ncbi:MAG: RHS repeat-associated core domain-containing protein [Planctomycetota bacterium]
MNGFWELGGGEHNGADTGESLGGPVGLSTGEFILVQTDLEIPGIGLDFEFRRTYRSRHGLFSTYFKQWELGHLAADGLAEAALYQAIDHPGEDLRLFDQPMGVNWDHNWNVRVMRPRQASANELATAGCTAGSGGMTVTFLSGNGQLSHFTSCTTNWRTLALDDAIGTYTRPEFDAVLSIIPGTTANEPKAEYRTSTGATYEFHPFDGSYVEGMLRRVIGRNYDLTEDGNKIELTYAQYTNQRDLISNAPQIDYITDSRGRQVDFEYSLAANSPHLLTAIVQKDASGNTIRRIDYQYDENVELATGITAGSGTFEKDSTLNPSGYAYDKDHLRRVLLPVIATDTNFSLPTDQANRFDATNRRKWEYVYGAEVKDLDNNWYWDSGQMTEVWPPNTDASGPTGSPIIKNEYQAVNGTRSLLLDQTLLPRDELRLSKQEIGSGTFYYEVTNATNGGALTSRDDDYTVWVCNRKRYVTRLDYAGDANINHPSGTLLLRERYGTPVASGVDLDTASWWLSYVSATPVADDSFTYNEDGQLNSVLDPAGTSVTITNFRDDLAARSGPNGDDPRKFLQVTQRAETGPDGQSITEKWEYEHDFGGGCCGSGFATAYIDGNENRSEYVYDTKGNILEVKHDKPDIVGASFAATESFTYTTLGQRKTHTLPTTTLSTGAPHSRVDRFEYGQTTAANDFGYRNKTIRSYVDGVNTINENETDLITQYEYDIIGNVTRIIEPDGDYTDRLFNQAGQLVRIRHHADGGELLAETEYFYDANGSMVREDVKNLVPNATTGVYELDSTNPVYTTLHEYDELNYRTKTAREIGGYDESSLTGVGAPSQAYDIATITSSTDGTTGESKVWAVTEYVYDANKNLVTTRRPEAVNGNQVTNASVMVHDARDLIIRTLQGIDPADVDLSDGTWSGSGYVPLITGFVYDANGRRTQTIVNPGGTMAEAERASKTFYDDFDRVRTRVDPMGNTVTYGYDSNHNKTSAATCGPAAADTSPGSSGNLLLTYTTLEYDSRDRNTVTNEFIYPISPSYGCSVPSSTGVVFFTAPTTQPKQITTATYNPDNSRDSATYLAGSGVIQNSTVTYRYDKAHRLRSTSDSLNNSVTRFYDTDSNLTRIFNIELELFTPESFSNSYAYDGLDRMIESVEGDYSDLPLPAGQDSGPRNTTGYHYDSRSNKIKITDPRNNNTELTYDGLGRRLSSRTVGALSGGGSAGGIDLLTTTAYDMSSRVTQLTDDNFNTTTYEYDGLARRIKTIMADATEHEVAFNRVSNLVESEDARGVVQTFAYDLNDRMLSRTISTAGVTGYIGALLEEFTYDGLGRVLTANNYYDVAKALPIATVSREYDSRSNMIQEVQSGRVVQHSHNQANNDIACTYPSGRVLTKSYDTLNRLTRIDDAATAGIVEYAYVGPDRVRRRTAGNGVTTTYNYGGFYDDANSFDGGTRVNYGVGRVRAITHGTITGFEFLWDAAGNKTQHNQLDPGSFIAHANRQNRAFGYDSADRLVTSAYDYPDSGAGSLPGELTYTLDGVHNRSSVTYTGDLPLAGGLEIGDYTLSDDPLVEDKSVNQYTKTAQGNAGTSAAGIDHEYDDNGNLVATNASTRFGDANGDGLINVEDFIQVLLNFGSTCGSGTSVPGDANDDCVVNVNDFIAVLLNFGSTTGNTLMSYDHRNQLTRIMQVDGAKNLTETRHEYDAFNRRVLTSLNTFTNNVPDPAEVTEFVYSGQAAWQLIAEYDYDTASQTSSLLAEYVYGNYIDEVVQMRRDVNGDGRTTTGVDAAAFQWVVLGDTCGVSNVVGQSPVRTNQTGVTIDADLASSGAVTGAFTSETDPNNAVSNPIWTRTANGIRVTFDTTGNQGSVMLLVSLELDDGCVIDNLAFFFDITDADDPAYYYHQDDLFTVYAITDDAGSVVERYEYADYGSPQVLEVWGTPRSNGAIESAVGNRHMYTGRLWDSTAKLYEYRHRWLWSDAGRFVQRDPLKYVDGMNMLSYVASNPLQYFDPLGLYSMMSIFIRPSAGRGISGDVGHVSVELLHLPDDCDDCEWEGTLIAPWGRHPDNDSIEGWDHDTLTQPGLIKPDVESEFEYVCQLEITDDQFRSAYEYLLEEAASDDPRWGPGKSCVHFAKEVMEAGDLGGYIPQELSASADGGRSVPFDVPMPEDIKRDLEDIGWQCVKLKN